MGRKLSACVFLVNDAAAPAKFYTEVFGVSGAEIFPGQYAFDFSENHRLWLSETLIPGVDLRAGLRLIHSQAEEMFARARCFGITVLPSEAGRVYRCLEPDGFVLTFIVPDEPGHHIYFASDDFFPEENEPFVKVSGGYYFIGSGKLLGFPQYATRAEAEVALENRRAMSTSVHVLDL